MLVVVVNISAEDGSVITGPDIITRGFVYVKESENLMEELRVIAAHAIDPLPAARQERLERPEGVDQKRPLRLSLQDDQAESDDPSGHHGNLILNSAA